MRMAEKSVSGKIHMLDYLSQVVVEGRRKQTWPIFFGFRSLM